MNSKNYRDIVLAYVDKLGEVDKAEDQLTKLKKEASDLKEQIDNAKGKNK
jgi:hypothetical protein